MTDGRPTTANPDRAASRRTPRPSPQAVGEQRAPPLLVAVGGSAGGLEAFEALLSAVPADSGMAFVFIQHLDPAHDSQLAALLGRVAHIPVEDVRDGTNPQANHAYVITPNTVVRLEGGALRVAPRADGPGPHLPVDALFRSVAAERHGQAIGVVLSGSGSDGTLGLGEIKAAGGVSFAQDEASARHAGMPGSAIASGCVDFVLEPAEIAARLVELGRHPYLADPVAHEAAEPDDESYRRILSAVRKATRVDFSEYRDTTIRRRILRRLALHGKDSLGDYARRLPTDPAEARALYHDLLVNVTSFFRDPEMFDVLKARVFPTILAQRGADAPWRLWVPGCSTGQETYSLAMALLEFLDDSPGRPRIQIFATDLADDTALEKARAGIYPESIESEVSPERLKRFFQREDHVYRIDKSIRDMCVFARHNVAADPPFSHMDLISCRNVLIYLSTALQKRVLPTFHYALNSVGFLVLGSAESVGDHVDLFETVDRTHRVFAKRAHASRAPIGFRLDPAGPFAGAVKRFGGSVPTVPVDFLREADRFLLGRYSPPGVLIDDSSEVLQFRGRTSAYLEAPPGEPTTNLFKLVREGLFSELRAGIDEARKTGKTVRRPGVRLRGAGKAEAVDLEIIPMTSPGGPAGCLLVLFLEGKPEAAAVAAATPPEEEAPPEDAHAVVEGLRHELASTRDYLQSLIGQHDAANEELRSANEEILSSYEELQSTNEELETAKEELQSANEELTTLNEQLQIRNAELNVLNNDLTNLLASTTIPVLMIGGDRRIRRFTPAARKVMNLLPTDVNRPFGDLRASVALPDLEAVVDEVLESAQPLAREVQDRDGHWFALRVHPYRTSDNRIDGVVIVMVDIDQLKRAEATLQDADRRKDEFLATLAHELRNPIAPIRNALEIVRRAGDDAGTVAQAHEVLNRQVTQLSRIIDDLIDVSRIVEHKIDLAPRQVDLALIVDAAVEATVPTVEAHRHRLVVAGPAEPLIIEADPDRLTQVLVNLVNNAVKFTEPGGRIWITSERSGNEAVIQVRDSGTGIAPELLPRMFDMFIQGHQGLDNRRSGLGVGLALVRTLVTMHGGTVEAHSAGVGQGSEFVVRLPLAAPSAAALPPSKSPKRVPTVSRRVLVVDDNLDQAVSLGKLLEMMGHEVHVTYDGLRALDAAEEFRPEVALIDIGLPGIDGYELARRLRRSPHLEHTVLVAQTGWGQPSDQLLSEQAGFDFHLVKPVAPERLIEILAAPLRKR
jgi:two-component system CheB/CheR fusion protein